MAKKRRTPSRIRLDELTKCYLKPPEERAAAIACVNANFGDGPMVRLKQCIYCKDFLPIDRLFYYGNRQSADGLNNTCKKCAYAVQKRIKIERKRAKLQGS